MLETLVSVDEYLTTSYHPDVDYVDGRIEDRKVGERDHGELQFWITTLLKRVPGVFAFLETRLKVSSTKYRVPNACAYLDRKPDEQVFTQPPFLCIEILSPEDRVSRMMRVAQDYFRMGVPNVWILDPVEKLAYVCEPSGGWKAATNQIGTNDGRIVFSLDAIFG